MTDITRMWELTRETVGDGRLSVIMPFYRLASSAESNIRSVADLFESHGIRVELVPVDDGSGDGTDEVFSRGLGDGYRHVVLRPVVCPRNGGKGAALRAGFAASSGEYVMLLDGDLDIHPAQTPWFFERMVETRADIVVGSKRHPRSSVQYPWHRRVVSAVYFALVRLFIGLPVTDTQTGMKLFRRAVLGDALGRMLVKAYAFDLELLAIAHQNGAKIAEAPVVIRFGSKFGALKPSTIREMAKDSLAVFYRLKLIGYYSKAEVPRPLDRRMLVSVVIACPRPTWMLRECLDSILRQTYGEWECIVLPDEGGDCGGDLQTVFDPRIVFMPTGKVRPAEKRNAGIRAAKGEIVAFIDDDAFADEHWLEYAVRYFSEPGIGAVGGPGVTPAGDPFYSQMGGRVYDNPLVSGGYRYRYKAGGVRRDVDDYPSCNLLVRKDLLDRIGGYRVDFWPGEDTLLCKDIIDAGKRIVYDPWVVVHHHRRPLFMPHLRQLGRYAFHRGYFCKRYPSNSLRFSYFVPSAFFVYLLTAAAYDIFAAFAHCPDVATVLVNAPLVLYAAMVLLSSFSFNPAAWMVTAAGVALSHLVYGMRFLQGLAARRAPCEFIGADHAASRRTTDG